MKKIITKFSAIIILVLAFCLSAGAVYAENTDGEKVFLDGVQIRLSANSGLRFIACVSGSPEDYDEVGIIAIPETLLTGELTLDIPDIAKISNLDSDFKYYDISENSFRYTLCFVNLGHKYFDRKYAVRPYIKFTEQGETKTVYGDNYTDYILSAKEVTAAILEEYADNYTEADKTNHDIIDGMLTDYNKYLDSIAPSEPEPEEPEAVKLLSLNEWYWKIGTLGSTNGAANESNTRRIYTPNYIPSDGTVITFDKASGIKYIVMEYDVDMKWLSTSNWITEESYTKRNVSAKYYRCVVTDEGVVTYDRIKDLSSHLTVMTPEIEYASESADKTTWQLGTLASATGEVNNALPRGIQRICTPEYLPAESEISFDGADGISYLVMEYDAEKKFINGTSFNNNSTYLKRNNNAEFYRIALRFNDDRNISESDIASLASHITVKQPDRKLLLKHSFFEIGNIGSDGNYSPSENHAYNSFYIPANVKITYDASKGFTYKVYYYTSDRVLLSSTDWISDKKAPEAPEGTAYFRMAIDPKTEVKTENTAYIGSAFEFLLSVTPEEWSTGTISGSTGIENLSAAQRLYTPKYYPADGITINHNTGLKKNNSVCYIVLPYDADKKFMTKPGSSGDRPRSSDGQPEGSFSITGDWKNASYFRFAMKTGANVTSADAAEYTEWLDITYPALSVTEYIPPKELDTVDDSGLNFRFGIGSIGTLSGGNYMSGLCMVEDELWLFSTSDKSNDGYGVALRYSVDFENKNAEYLGYFRHNFGHTNSIDYNKSNKCLTFGNGSGSFSDTQNYIYVYKNAYDKVKNGAEVLELGDAICFDWAECQIPKMTKLNSCWYGDSSIFVGANNNGYVYKIALGKGSRVLKYGAASEVSENEFNGTWDIIKSYEMPDNFDNAQVSGFRGQGYDECNQGTCYYNGTLYLTCGHNGVYFWRCRLDGDGVIKRDEFHKYISLNGSVVTGAISGIDRYGDYLIFTNGGYVNIYRDSSLK